MSRKLLKYVTVIRTNWKKSLLATALGLAGAHWGANRLQENRLIEMACLEMVESEDCQPHKPATTRTRRLLVFLNPAAGDRKAVSRFERVCAPILHLAGTEVRIVKTEAEGEAKALVTEADECDGLVIAGGDGTVCEVLTGLQRSAHPRVRSLPVAVIPLGAKHNTLAKRIRLEQEQKVASKSDDDEDSVLGALKKWFQPTSYVPWAIICTQRALTGLPQPVGMMEVRPEGKDRSFYCIGTGLSMGMLRDCEDTALTKEKFWYFGPLKRRVTYWWHSFHLPGNHNSALGADTPGVRGRLDYTPPCNGCVNCKQEEIASRKWHLQQKRWWHALMKRKNPGDDIADYESIHNPLCSEIHSIALQSTVQVNILPKSDHISMEILEQLNPMEYFQLSGYTHEDIIDRKMLRQKLKTIACKEFWFTPEGDRTSQFWLDVDSERFEVLPLYGKFHPKKLNLII